MAENRGLPKPWDARVKNRKKRAATKQRTRDRDSKMHALCSHSPVADEGEREETARLQTVDNSEPREKTKEEKAFWKKMRKCNLVSWPNDIREATLHAPVQTMLASWEKITVLRRYGCQSRVGKPTECLSDFSMDMLRPCAEFFQHLSVAPTVFRVAIACHHPIGVFAASYTATTEIIVYFEHKKTEYKATWISENKTDCTSCDGLMCYGAPDVDDTLSEATIKISGPPNELRADRGRFAILLDGEIHRTRMYT